MANLTTIIFPDNETRVYIKWQQASWVVPEAIGIILTVTVVWILFSVVYYGVKAGKWRKTQFGNVEKLNGGVVYTTVVVCIVVTLLRYITSQAELNLGIGVGKGEECQRISKAALIMYAFTVLAVYVFMWLRQFIFYQNNMLKTPWNRTLKFISAGSILLLFLSGLGTIIALFSSRKFLSAWDGCISEPATESSNAVILIICALNFILSQLLLLWLFIYPLQKSKHLGQRTVPTQQGEPGVSEKVNQVPNDLYGSSSSRIYTPNTSNSKKSKSIIKKRSTRAPRKTSRLVRIIMKRTIVFAAISMVTDLVCLGVSFYVIPQNDSRRIATIIYDLNAFLNLLFVIGSFRNWRVMLLFPLGDKQPKNENSLTTSNAFANPV